MPRSGPGAVTGLPSTRMRPATVGKKAADQIEQGGFAAARRPEQSQEFPRPDFERHVGKGEHGAPARRAIGVVHPLDDDLALAVHEVPTPQPVVTGIPGRLPILDDPAKPDIS